MTLVRCQALQLLGIVAIMALGISCRGAPVRRVYLVVHAPASERIDLDAFGWHGIPEARAFVRLSSSRGLLTIELAPQQTSVTLSTRDACTEVVNLQSTANGSSTPVELRARLRVPAFVAQVGFDADFTIRAHTPCPEDHDAPIGWAQTAGEPLSGVQTESGGRVFRAHTQTFSRHHPAPAPLGLVPLSPRTQGVYTLVLRLDSPRGSYARRVDVTAAARATGVPSIAPQQRVYLGGRGWHVTERPGTGRADVTVQGGIETFLPDIAGRWLLADRAGHELQLGANRYDDTMLDCGRSECHASATRDAQPTAMTHVLEAGLTGRLGPAYRSSCAIRCHAVGEPGHDDGGFVDVAARMDHSLSITASPDAWDSLPRSLRRLGGVGCAACHGPGALPQRDARWAILRTDVCATCHDQPPRYAHVVAWESNRMSHADRDVATRSDPRCAQCHTTYGFLAAIGARTTPSAPPPDATPVGITCAACHAAHSTDRGAHLVRRVSDDRTFTGALSALGAGAETSSVCVRCHSPLSGARWPDASAASVVLGRSARFAEAAPTQPLPAPHAAVPGGCTGCHRAGSTVTRESRGVSHAFGVDRSVCASCHANGTDSERPDASGRTIAARLDAALRRLATSPTMAMWVASSARAASTPPTALHATPTPTASAVSAVTPTVTSAPWHVTSTSALDGTGAGATTTPTSMAPASPNDRALWDVLLLSADRAAAVHNARFARTLLDQIERLLGTSTTPP